MDRRDFLKRLCWITFFGGVLGGMPTAARAIILNKTYDTTKHCYGMGVDIDKCIGCGRCMQACKTENGVPADPYYFRTWVERYVINTDQTVSVNTINMESNEQVEITEKNVLRSFFVPKLCNQCDHPPCVQVCPVGATFKTEDGVVLVNGKTCIGCRYCIQACPYGARYLHPVTRVVDKCTFCYHRLVRGLLPACVEVCPTQARIFGDVKSIASPLMRFTRMNKIHVLKPSLNTDPKVYYANLDGEVN
jgi:tetrathionate reductase subunit B